MRPGFTFGTAAGTAGGQGEDRVAVFESGECLVIVVADGAGGVAGGAMASEAVVSAVRERIATGPLDAYDLRGWSELLIATDAMLVRQGGETTAIVTVVGPHGVAGVSAGDSEAWIVGPRIDRLTHEQARARAGSGKLRAHPFYRRALEGTLIVATDGLFAAAGSRAIARSCTGSVPEIVEKLIALPRLPSGAYPDDIAIAVVDVPSCT